MCQVGRHHDVKNFVLTCTCIVSPQVMKVEDLKELGSEAAVKVWFLGSCSILFFCYHVVILKSP
jgi:hypothetical protein